jgi:HD-GYP domain-containing protein (c-di-GMP phosphodiesterase class II)
MIREPLIPLFQLMMSLSSAIDLISPVVSAHHKQVAYISLKIATELGLPLRTRQNILLAAMLHDVGSFSLEERIETINFEITNPHKHAFVGYSLLNMFEPFKKIAEIVRYHHVPWKFGVGREFMENPVPIESHVIHLADRLAVLIDKNHEILGQVLSIQAKIFEPGADFFMPEALIALNKLTQIESFWLDAHSDINLHTLESILRLDVMELDPDTLLALSHLFAYIIDFRSHFTSTHTAGVAATAEALAKIFSFSSRECQAMKVAGNFHDIGKLAIPQEILEKPGKLTAGEERVMRSHTFHSYKILEPIAELRTINAWGAFHHERLNGGGYPFHLKEAELSLGSRIMAVADIFTAISENRPYRIGMKHAEVRSILHNMAHNHAIDQTIVNIFDEHFDAMDQIRIDAQEEAHEKYEAFLDNVKLARNLDTNHVY